MTNLPGEPTEFHEGLLLTRRISVHQSVQEIVLLARKLKVNEFFLIGLLDPHLKAVRTSHLTVKYTLDGSKLWVDDAIYQLKAANGDDLREFYRTLINEQYEELENDIEHALKDLSAFARLGLPDSQVDAYSQTVSDILREELAESEQVQAEVLQLQLAMIDNTWRAWLERPEATHPVRSAVTAGGIAFTTVVGLIASIVGLATASLPLAIIVALVCIAALAGIVVTASQWPRYRRSRPKKRGAK